jgi:hypothetical protein
MAKRKTPKTVNLKAEKLTAEELKELQDLVRNLNMAQADIGMIEIRKHEALHAVLAMTTKYEQMNSKFREKYNAVDFDIQTGIIKYNDDDEDNKKDNDR